MSEAEPSKVTTTANEAPGSKRNSGQLLRGCGCLTGLGVLGLGILITGDFDATSWASALTAIIVGFLVFQLSGVNGMWDDK